MVPSLNSPMVLLVLLALCSTQPAKAFAAEGGMTILEVEMAEKGSFSYASLPEDKMELLFKKYLLTYSREYATTEERAERYKLFKETLVEVDTLNKAEKADDGSAIFGITKTADLSPKEFHDQYLGAVLPTRHERKLTQEAEVRSFKGTETSVDWRGILSTPIKDQGGCGSCWAFSAVAQMESDSIRAGLTTPDTILSVQQLTKCTYDNSGCRGGWPETAYHYVKNTGGITFDNVYPYDIPAESCDKSKRDFAVTVANNYAVWGEQKMIDHVLGGGTLAAVVDSTIWGPYKSGIFSSCVGKPNINHGVNIVGVNVDEGYWIIRNSWGDWWGDKGYMKLALGVNMCGITSFPTFVDMAPVGPPQPMPSKQPTLSPSVERTPVPTPTPTRSPTQPPTLKPSSKPTDMPTAVPTSDPTKLQAKVRVPTDRGAFTTKTSSIPSRSPTSPPTQKPTPQPTCKPTDAPTSTETRKPMQKPTFEPTGAPTSTPTAKPTPQPTCKPTDAPTETRKPMQKPTFEPTGAPTSTPTAKPTPQPTCKPTDAPTETRKPMQKPTCKPTGAPTAKPTPKPTCKPSVAPTSTPRSTPTLAPKQKSTDKPYAAPTSTPRSAPSQQPTDKPNPKPTALPTQTPTDMPSALSPSSPKKRDRPTRRPTKQRRPTAAPVADDDE